MLDVTQDVTQFQWNPLFFQQPAAHLADPLNVAVLVSAAEMLQLLHQSYVQHTGLLQVLFLKLVLGVSCHDQYTMF